MANTGLFRLIVGLLLCSVVARVQAYADPLSSRSWIHNQKFKRSDQTVHLSHGTTDIDKFPGSSHRQVDPSLIGGISFSGPESRLSDFHQTTSSWKLVGCTTKPSKQQKVLAYCTGADPLNDCGGIFIGGVEHTIIKLAEGCGASPFARVVHFAPSKRKLPTSERNLVGKQKVAVFDLIFDYRFDKIPYKAGDSPVLMHMEYTNIVASSQAPGFGTMRPYDSWFAAFSETLQNNGTTPIDHDFSANLASMSQQCNGFSMSLEMDVLGNINGSVNYGYYVTGSIVPPQIDNHYAYLMSNAFVTTQVNLTGSVVYTFDAVSVPVLPAVGIPGLSYPGLLSLGPYFEINAGITGDIKVSGSMTTNTGFNMPPVHISVGNNTAPQASNNATNYAEVILSKEIQISTGLTFALTPQVGVQLNVLSGIVNADVSLQPSAGVTAGGTVNFNTQNDTVSNPCVELDGQLDLNWVVAGSLGPWGASVTGRIWDLTKKLYSHCFNTTSTSQKRSIAEENGWKIVDRSTIPTAPVIELAALVCPSTNPFNDPMTSP